MDYSEWIENIKKEWIGKTILYEGKSYKVVGVDYNGCLLIDRKTRWNDTTAVEKHKA